MPGDIETSVNLTMTEAVDLIVHRLSVKTLGRHNKFKRIAYRL